MKGRTALVTGASRGIGAAIAAKFRAEGANVVGPARAELDLSSAASIDAYLGKLSAPVDILVNCAGMNRLGSSVEVADGHFEETLQVHLLGPFRLARALAPKMASRRWGRILNISSVWSLVTRERRVTYSSAKSAMNGLTRSLAVEYGPSGVLVNALAPGYVDTELTRKNNSAEEIAQIEKAIPLGRLGNPAELAEAASFLCSGRNGYITGQVLVADGGYTCR
jgi:3-oxoacyl-[acyl-carrier protein] reductase